MRFHFSLQHTYWSRTTYRNRHTLGTNLGALRVFVALIAIKKWSTGALSGRVSVLFSLFCVPIFYCFFFLHKERHTRPTVFGTRSLSVSIGALFFLRNDRAGRAQFFSGHTIMGPGVSVGTPEKVKEAAKLWPHPFHKPNSCEELFGKFHALFAIVNRFLSIHNGSESTESLVLFLTEIKYCWEILVER